MIILNNAKELVHVELWSDIEARVGFTAELDPKNHELASIIGRYDFPYRIHCGLTNCHAPHFRGYIVATKDGRETNIGKDCGKKYFGVDFETLTRKFDQDLLDKDSRERLWNLRSDVARLKEEIGELRSQKYGADWVYRKSRPLVEAGRGLPNEIVRALLSMVKTRSNVVVVERVATEEEIEKIEASGNRKIQRPFYIETPVGQIDGMTALFPENDLRQLLVIDLENEMRKFEQLDIDSASSVTLKHWSKWNATIPATMDSARLAVNAGRNLLNESNLAPLIHLARSPEGADQVIRYTRGLRLEY